MKTGGEILSLVEGQIEVRKFLEFTGLLPLDFEEVPEEFKYHDPVCILADATLSMNRHYKNFVVPRVQRIQKIGITSLTELGELIELRGIDGMSEFWNYNHPERVRILRDLVKKFLEFKMTGRGEDEMDVLYTWGREAKPTDWKEFGVKGIGFTTYQYLRILCGADTVKPDIHIKRAVEAAIQTRKPLDKVVELVEMTAQEMNVSARKLDYALWRYYSRNS